jgi:hypothetical protein
LKLIAPYRFFLGTLLKFPELHLELSQAHDYFCTAKKKHGLWLTTAKTLKIHRHMISRDKSPR